MKLVGLLDDIEPPERILDIGCGTGQLTRLVADKFPKAEIVAFDIAGKAVDVARNRFAGGGKVHFQVANALTFKSSVPFQLIVSGASFHWVESLGALFRNVAGTLSPDGRLIFSMMLHGTLSELRDSRARAVQNKPATTDLPVVGRVTEAISAANLNLIKCETELLRTEYASATEFLYTLHNTGVTGGVISSSGAPLNRSELAALLADYIGHYQTECGGVFASFNVMYAVAGHKG